MNEAAKLKLIGWKQLGLVTESLFEKSFSLIENKEPTIALDEESGSVIINWKLPGNIMVEAEILPSLKVVFTMFVESKIVHEFSKETRHGE